VGSRKEIRVKRCLVHGALELDNLTSYAADIIAPCDDILNGYPSHYKVDVVSPPEKKGPVHVLLFNQSISGFGSCRDSE
jgi:hypothetical protein